MDFSKLGGMIAAVAPSLATALGGPLAGAAVKTIGEALLNDEKATAPEIEAAIANASPETLAKLRDIDAQFAIRMRELDIDLERINAADRTNARQREIATKDWTPRILAFCILSGYFAALFFLMIRGMPTSGSESLIMMLGALTNTLTGVVSYYYGASASKGTEPKGSK